MQDDLDSEFEEVHELLEEDHEDRRKRSPDASSNRRNNRGRGRGNKGRNRGRNGNSQNVGNLNNDFSASMGMYFFLVLLFIRAEIKNLWGFKVSPDASSKRRNM